MSRTCATSRIHREVIQHHGHNGSNQKSATSLVRGVSFNPREAPEVKVCYGDVQIADHHSHTSMPKLYRAPMVLWTATPPRRARISIGP